MENITPADLITIEEAAELLGIPVATLRTWRLNGKGPRAARVGKRIWFIRPEVEGYQAKVVAQAFAEQNERTA